MFPEKPLYIKWAESREALRVEAEGAIQRHLTSEAQHTVVPSVEIGPLSAIDLGPLPPLFVPVTGEIFLSISRRDGGAVELRAAAEKLERAVSDGKVFKGRLEGSGSVSWRADQPALADESGEISTVVGVITLPDV